MNNIIIDNISAILEISHFETFSERIKITFNTPHPEYGKCFMTKYYNFLNENEIVWGFENKTIKWINI